MFNPFAKIYNNILQTGYDMGYTKGIDIGQKAGFKQGQTEGYKIGFKEGESQGLSKGYEKAYIEIEQEIQDRVETNEELTDSIMLFLKSLVEIVNTNFFINTCFEDCNSTFIKKYLDFIDYAESNFELKANYPQTHYYLPELKKAFTQIYDNKLVVEEAEMYYDNEFKY